MKKLIISVLLGVTVCMTQAATLPKEKTVVAAPLVELNTIAAVVNDTPIPQSTLDQRVNMVKMQLTAHQIQLPPMDILTTQVLNQLIQEQLQLQLADSRHIQASQAQVNEQLQKIADEQKITLTELYQQATQSGFTRDSYRQQLQDQMRIHELVQTTLAVKIVITPKDVTLYRNSQLAQATNGKEYQVANIVIPLNTSPSAEQIKTAEAKANAILNDIKSGKMAFDQAAVLNSSGQFALEGGNLGFRPIAELPEVFAQMVSSMQVGDIGGPIRAGNGIQLIKLVAIKDQQQQLTDDQIRQALFKRKLEEAYPIWLASLESQAFIQRNI